MTDVTLILSQIENGDQQASIDLLPLVYDELRKLAAARMANERSDHTLQATALVHEAYVRLVDVDQAQQWNGRGHFYSAAAEAMRRILVEHARQKMSKQRGGDQKRVALDQEQSGNTDNPELVLQVNEALEKVAEKDALAAELIKLRFFAGLSVSEAAKATGISRETAYHHWRYAKAMIGHIFD